MVKDRMVTRIRPGRGILVVDLGRGQIVALDFAAFLEALHREVMVSQGMSRRSADDWPKMVDTALRKVLDNGRPGAA